MSTVSAAQLGSWMDYTNWERATTSLEDSIAGAESSLEGHWGRRITDVGTVARVLSVRAGSVLFLPDVIAGPNPYLADNPKFEVRDSVDSGWLELDSTTDLEFVHVNDWRGVFTAVRRLGTVLGSRFLDWPVGDDLVRATYLAGYDLYDAGSEVRALPSDLKIVILDEAARLFRSRPAVRGGREAAATSDNPAVAAARKRWAPPSNGRKTLTL